MAVYIPPSAHEDAPGDMIRQQPSVFLVVTGDFNHSLEATFPSFQLLHCLFYANIRDASSSPAQPVLSEADHNLVSAPLHLQTYRPEATYD